MRGRAERIACISICACSCKGKAEAERAKLQKLGVDNRTYKTEPREDNLE